MCVLTGVYYILLGVIFYFNIFSNKHGLISPGTLLMSLNTVLERPTSWNEIANRETVWFGYKRTSESHQNLRQKGN
jgi:hypothetical protein